VPVFHLKPFSLIVEVCSGQRWATNIRNFLTRFLNQIGGNHDVKKMSNGKRIFIEENKRWSHNILFKDGNIKIFRYYLAIQYYL